MSCKSERMVFDMVAIFAGGGFGVISVWFGLGAGLKAFSFPSWAGLRGYISSFFCGSFSLVVFTMVGFRWRKEKKKENGADSHTPIIHKTIQFNSTTVHIFCFFQRTSCDEYLS